MGYTKPTKIQSETLVNYLKGGDLLCLSETGSGKTLSFVLPILDFIRKTYKHEKIPYGVALIIAPTRELCVQTNEYFERFQQAGLSDIKSVVLYGGVDPMKQVIEIAKKPHVIVTTPGRILDHLQKTKGFHLNNLKFLVLDEADKLLNKDFEEQVNEIIASIPQERRAFLFSATLTNRVDKLQRVCLKDPTRIEVNQKYQTVTSL
jgi:ATP-dependent RNA helicase DDX47/RRP3